MGERAARRAFVASLCVLIAGCAADTSRDTEPFNAHAGLTLEAPPPRDDQGENDRQRALESRRGRLAQALTLDEAQQIALEANPGFLANADAVDAAKARIDEASRPHESRLQLRQERPAPRVDQPQRHAHEQPARHSSTRGSQRVSTRSSCFQKDFDVSGKRVARVDNAIENERQSEAQYASAAHLLKAQVHVAYADDARRRAATSTSSREARDMASRNLKIVG